ncbi:MAG TPA: oligosaccharide flippase family protein [Solirubrobacteraceae bacterium]|jgi:O-antigen/teichoic acid export membrane protein|nr:oligosaccharide flippase family protein [Solirubrobacteraceae bacterium]
MTAPSGPAAQTRPTPARLRSVLGASVATSVAIQLINVVTGVLIARRLGPHGRGELTAVILWPSLFALIGSLGVSDALTFRAARRGDPTGTLVGSGLTLAVVQSLVLMAVGLVLIPVVLGRYGAETRRTGELFLLYVPLNLASLYLMGVLNGLQRMGSYQLLRLVVIATTGAGLVLVAVLGQLTVRDAVLVYLAANLLTLLLAAALTLPLLEGPVRVALGTCRELVHYGVRSHTSNVSVYLNARLDQLLVSLFLAPTLLGLYTVAVTLGSLTLLIGGSVALIALPAIAALERGPGRTERARALIAVTAVLGVLITVPLLIGAPAVISLFFGHAFAGAVTAARVLLVGTMLFGINRVLEALLKGVGRPLDAGIAETVAVVVTVLALAVALPLLGLVGAALASVAAALTSGLILTRRATVALDCGWRELLSVRGGDLAALWRSLWPAGAGH